MPLLFSYNAATRFLKARTSNYIAGKKKPVERIYELLLYIRLFAGTPCGRVNDAGARLLHSVGCLYVRAGAAVCGCLCDRLSCPPLPACRPASCPARSAASGQWIRRSGWARPARAVSSPPLLSVPFCPLLSACSRVVRVKVVSRKVVKSKVVRES